MQRAAPLRVARTAPQVYLFVLSYLVSLKAVNYVQFLPNVSGAGTFYLLATPHHVATLYFLYFGGYGLSEALLSAALLTYFLVWNWNEISQTDRHRTEYYDGYAVLAAMSFASTARQWNLKAETQPPLDALL